MKKINFIILIFIAHLSFSCGNDEKKEPKKNIKSVNVLTPAGAKVNSLNTAENITVPKNIESKKTTDKKTLFAVKKAININGPIEQSTNNTTINDDADIKKEVNDKLLSFINLRKILDNSKIGQTLTQKQLTQNFEIPKEAVKLVKSLTKTAENELDVKWQSTWLVEKVSDAELEDGKMKVIFKANKVYTSGKAIGIKYNKKIYNDLVIIGRSAYIPSVKGFSWEIGK